MQAARYLSTISIFLVIGTPRPDYNPSTAPATSELYVGLELTELLSHVVLCGIT